MSCGYNFKKEAKVYVVSEGRRYNIDISDISFSQTFEEHSYSNKTIQEQNMFEQSIINKANPANFELIIPAIKEYDFQILFTKSLDCTTFDLFIHVGENIFKIENCVVTNFAIIAEKGRVLTMKITGEGIKLSLVGTLEGIVQARSVNMSYNRVNHIDILIFGEQDFERITSLQINLNNNISWVPYTNVHESDTVIYPYNYVIKDKVLSGSIVTYNMQDVSWGTDSLMHLEVGERVNDEFFGFKVIGRETMFTNTINTEDVFTQKYIWRVVSNSDTLYPVFKYITIVDDFIFIQDSLGISILDSNNLAIVENW